MKKFLTAAFAVTVLTGMPVAKDVAADDFFTKKQLVMMVAARAGSGFNAYGRTVAR